ncbi:MAG: molybdopterin-dependent oxidoreductase [Moraxellaceae bacterium]|nr:molybdopterin-dependent oxidoreductase [Moraxellaceae bacterium]MCC6199434.1 molybdopterin-dependent oxidoreductase [Moraxellaceae bacterium]HQV42277.1 molybdopterin-dependent oxidoreductase [Moraxellaceae bacterium]HQX89022.1 molybdopterin-dependent oxidoreductase [Moraxellaceae bacterium]
MKLSIRLVAVILTTCLAGTALADKKTGDTAQYVTTSIHVHGAVEKSLTLNVDDMRKFSADQTGEFPIICQSGAKVGTMENHKGVLLKDILNKAVIKTVAHNDVKKMMVIASASDGYKVVFSWSELFNSPIGDGVLVMFEKDGNPIGDEEGRLALISTKDIRTGSRHVKWLNDIEVRKVVE